MATDYSKKTNAELVDILKARSLPHTGKKAELVARIQEDDQKKPAEDTAAKTDAAEDVIDWDDDVPAESTEAPAASTEAGASAIAAGNPVAVPNQQLDVDPATTDDLKVESTGEVHAEAEAEKKPAVDYTRGLPATELEEELRKRKARAEKFGIVEDTETAVKEAEKSLARAKRFGTGAEGDAAASVGVKGLDEALSQDNPRKRGRTDQGGRGGKRRDQGRDHGRNRQRRGDGRQNQNQNQNQNRGKANNGAQASGGQKSSGWSEKDHAAMEARKKRFATAA